MSVIPKKLQEEFEATLASWNSISKMKNNNKNNNNRIKCFLSQGKDSLPKIRYDYPVDQTYFLPLSTYYFDFIYFV